MPWQPLTRIAFAVATYPFHAESPADLPLEIGDELYIIEETSNGHWLRGYLVAPPSLLAGLTSVQGQTLEARVFSGIFPRSCIEIRELLGENDEHGTPEFHSSEQEPVLSGGRSQTNSSRHASKTHKSSSRELSATPNQRKPLTELSSGVGGNLSIPVKRDPKAPRPAAPVPMLKIGDETSASASEPLIDEISSCLREWHSKNLHQLLLSRQYNQLDRLSQLVATLYLHRQQLLYNVLTEHEYELLREKTVWNLVQFSKLCGGEVIVRDPSAHGRILTSGDSVVAMTDLQAAMTVLDEPPQTTYEMTNRHHLLLEFKGFAGKTSGQSSLIVYLVSKPQQSKAFSLTESFGVDVPAGGTIGNLPQDASTKTLFTDLSGQDIGDGAVSTSDLYLVIKVQSSYEVPTSHSISRSGTSATSYYAKEHTKSLPTTGNKASRRSFMWGSMGSRSAHSRGSRIPQMDAVSEETNEHSQITRTHSRGAPPNTAGSRDRASFEASHTAQRTVGIGVLKLNTIIKQPEQVERLISIWSRTREISAQDLEEDWDPLILELMGLQNEQFEKSARGDRLQVSVKGFEHPDADALISATPTLLAGVSKTPRIGFFGAPTKPRSDIYFTLNTAALAKQNLLSRYGGSATSLPSGLQATNLQITMEVRQPSGQRHENCIFPSSNSKGITTFKSIATERGEGWNQTLRLSLSPSEVSDAHIVLYLADVPNMPFALAHLPLWDRGAFIRDGRHGLLLYKIDENTSTAHAGPIGKGGYLSLPWAPRGGDEYSADVTGPLAVLLVETYLCSTRFSQDRVVLGLLRWKELSQEHLITVLQQLTFVPEIELVKLLSDVLDSLFGVLVEHSGNEEYEDLVFTALVRLLGISYDRRFNLVPLVDQYATSQFNYPYATACLMRSLTRLLETPTEPDSARKLRATLKIVRHILKFITHAREQQKTKEADIGITSSTQGFSRQIRSVFKALDEMMRNPAPVLVGSQTLAVQHFHTWLPELTGLLSTEEILHIAIDFMDACSNVKSKLILHKLVLILNYGNLEIFSHPDQKSALSANTVRWISPHWGHTAYVDDQWRSQVRLCCSVLASQMESLGPEIPDHAPRAIDSYLALLAFPQSPRDKLSLLFPTAYPFPTKSVESEIIFDEGLAELSAVISAMSNSPAGLQLELADGDLTVVLDNILRVQLSILIGEAFPEGWLSIHVYHHKSAMHILQYIASILLETCLPDPDDAEIFNTELWKVFFMTLLKLVGSPSLALETFAEQKRRAVWKIAGDVREEGATLLRTTWEAIGWETTNDERARYGLSKIGGYQVQYVPTLVGPIVELCLSVHEGLRRMAVEVLQTMIVSEWTLSEDLSTIQMEMIDCLDSYFKSKPLTESVLQKLFLGESLERFASLSSIPEEPFYTAVQELIGTVDEFLDLLVAVHSSDGSNGASDIINRLRLMEFLRDMQKEEIFVRYVHQLAELQVDLKNHSEAGLALRLHADLYDWDPVRHAPAMHEPVLPAQTQFERKERVFFDMIKHFEDGESWSNALTAYKELQTQYETNIFDFAKLARTERAIASIYETISKTEKLSPRYFKVVYKGLGFPSTLRDKCFIYEGLPSERASAFMDKMQEQYPSARIMSNEDVDEVEGQFLVISTVSPHKDLTHQVFQRTRVAQAVRDFLLSSHPQNFSFTTKRIVSGAVQEHYTKKTIFVTAEPFPTILRRSEVVDIYETRLGAKETALERIVRKTQELAVLEHRVAGDSERNSQLLVDAVAGCLDHQNESSIMCYRALLPSLQEGYDNDDDDDDGSDKEAELEPQDVSIKAALVDHAITIKGCLALLARVRSDSMRQEELNKEFEAAFGPEIVTFAPPQTSRDAISTPTTTWQGSSPSTVQSPQWTSIATSMNGAKTEEAAIVRQISLRNPSSRRLSFLGGRKKSEDQSKETDRSNGIFDTVNNRKLSVNEDKIGHTRLWSQSTHDGGYRLEEERRGSSATRESLDNKIDLSLERTLSEKESVKRGSSVRKRLSKLKLGITGNKSGTKMGSLDEE